jgi:polyferredoxin
MDRVARPRGLIAYDTDAAVLDRSQGRKGVYRLIRSRTMFYAVVLLGLTGLMAWGLSNRSPVEAHVLRDRNPTFVRLHDGSIRDGYTLKIANRAFEDRTFAVTVDGLAGARLRTPGSATAANTLHILARANQVGAVRVFVTAPAASVSGSSQPLTFRFSAPQAQVEVKTVFLSGAANRP